MPKRIAHAEELEHVIVKGKFLGVAGFELRINILLRLVQHPLAGINSPDGFGIAHDFNQRACDRARAARHIQGHHAFFQSGTLQCQLPIEVTGAQKPHRTNPVVMTSAAVEQILNELSLAGFAATGGLRVWFGVQRSRNIGASGYYGLQNLIPVVWLFLAFIPQRNRFGSGAKRW